MLRWPAHYPPTQTGKPNGYTGETRWKPVIDATGREPGFFDYHFFTPLDARLWRTPLPVAGPDPVLAD